MKKELFVIVGRKRREDKYEIGEVREGYRKEVDGLTLFVRKEECNGYHHGEWVTTEAGTGYAVAWGSTIKEALENSHNNFMNHLDVLKRLQDGEGYEKAREIVKNTPLVKSHDSQESKGE